MSRSGRRAKSKARQLCHKGDASEKGTPPCPSVHHARRRLFLVVHRSSTRHGEVMAWLTLVAGIVLQAVITALLGLSLTPTDSLLVLAIAAAACVLSGAVAGRRHRPELLRRPSAMRALVGLNVWTAVMFVAFFLGVAIYGAPVVFTLEASFAPLAVTAWSALRAHRGGAEARPRPAQWGAACVLAALGAALVVVLAQAASAGMTALLLAAALGIISGVAAAGLVIVSRELGRNGADVRYVMAHRFYATFVFATTALVTLVPPGFLEPPALHFGMAGVAALASIVTPLFLLQYAMQRLAPLSITAALATMPAITFGIELASGRPVSWGVLLLGLLIVPGSVALLITQREQTPTSPRPFVPNPPAAADTCEYVHATTPTMTRTVGSNR
jgi:drug/metabolite transporter (DMT)-like permease